jgi:streptogramin lyase
VPPDPGGLRRWKGDGVMRGVRVLLVVLAMVVVALGAPAGASLDQVTNLGDVVTLAGSLGSGLYGTAVDADGNVYVAYLPGNVVLKITPAGVTSTVAGTGSAGFFGDGEAATAAKLAGPEDVAIGPDGNLYIADSNNNRIRKLDMSNGKIYTVAGSGAAGQGLGGYTGDSGPATSATLDGPTGVAFDGDGVMYILDYGNDVIRTVDTGGDIDTLAEVTAYSIDVTADGTVYAAADSVNKILAIDPAGTVTVYAGTGGYDDTGDGGPATDATMKRPTGVAVNAAGDVYVAETDGHLIRKIDHATLKMSTVGGDGTASSTGDAGPAVDATFDGPIDLSFDAAGNLYVTEYLSQKIRVIAYADTDGDTFPDLIDNFPLVYSNCQGQQATIAGDDTADVLNGTSGPDVIVGNGGADTINGNGGRDLICAGDGADIVHGGGGRDVIYGDKGGDTIYGDKKSDKLYGGDGDDAIYGNGGGHDRLSGNKGTDTLNGGSGANDECSGGETYAACEVIA